MHWRVKPRGRLNVNGDSWSCGAVSGAQAAAEAAGVLLLPRRQISDRDRVGRGFREPRAVFTSKASASAAATAATGVKMCETAERRPLGENTSVRAPLSAAEGEVGQPLAGAEESTKRVDGLRLPLPPRSDSIKEWRRGRPRHCGSPPPLRMTCGFLWTASHHLPTATDS